MTVLVELPPELILHAVSFLTREIIINIEQRLPGYTFLEAELVPDLPSINALAQTSVNFRNTLDKTLYDLRASVEPLGRLALLFAVEHQLETAVDKLVADGISLAAEFKYKHSWGPCTLLHTAADMGLQTIVVKLLGMYEEEMAARVHTRKGAHNTQDGNTTALDRAAFRGHMEIVRLLAPFRMPSYDGVPPSDTFQTHEQYFGVALAESAIAGHLEISKYLVSEGADVNFLDPRHFFDYTPLHFASRTENLGLVEFLLASGADPNLRGARGMVPLFDAADVDVAQALLSAGADIHAEDDASRNFLAFITDIDLFCFFLEQGVDPNHEDDRGNTPLHYVGRGDLLPRAAVQLLQFGAAVERVNQAGKTPVDIAMDKGGSTVVKTLEPHVQDPALKARITTWWAERA